MTRTSIIKIDPLNPDIAKIKETARVLKEGGIVCLPTETVYGLAANLSNKETIDRLYEIKKRPRNKPFSIHIAQFQTAEELAENISPLAYKLIYKFWPGPLTVILKSKDGSAVGLRMPRNKIALAVILESGVPIVMPSANISEEPAPSTFEDAFKNFNGLIDMALDSGKTEIGIESMVVDLTGPTMKILREGACDKTEIERLAKTKTVLFVCTGNSCRSVMAKGLLEKLLKDRPGIEVLAAGIGAFPGMAPTNQTVELLKEEGVDMSEYRAQVLSDEMVKKSDLILVMEKRHELNILERIPQARNRLYLLKEFANIIDASLDIADPIGKSMEFYREVFNIIKESIERVAKLA